MKIIAGQAVRKENFWDRNKELEDMWYKLGSGSHILLVAPRRVGKTSIMYNILDCPKEDYIVFYIDTESADSENEFWKKLFNRLMEEEFASSFQNKAKHFFTQLKTIKISEISTKGIKFGDGTLIDYAQAFKKVMSALDTDKKLIIMIDEFAQAVENIMKYESIKSAQSLLQTHRALRQDQAISDKVRFIYAGSIGLESVATKIDSISTINDLAVVKVAPLVFDDAKAFIKALAKSNTITLDDTAIDYLLHKIEWLIPFYIQLVMDELRKANATISMPLIDKAFLSILDNRNHFEHWHSRLKSLADEEYKFSKEILSSISEHMTMPSNEVNNIATKHTLSEDRAKQVIHSLQYDGYINNNDNPKEYRFNSPILRMWWCNNVAN